MPVGELITEEEVIEYSTVGILIVCAVVDQGRWLLHTHALSIPLPNSGSSTAGVDGGPPVMVKKSSPAW